jgi:thiol:disulfide interchange protein
MVKNVCHPEARSAEGSRSGTRFLASLGMTLALGMTLLAGVAVANVANAPHVQAELVAERDALAPGDNWVALRLKPEAGWHTYHLEPGDVGLATALVWTLPPDYAAGEIQWPAPETFRLGDETSYGYSTETLHLVRLTVPADAAGGEATLEAQASWLVCKDQCIPGKARLTLTLPVRDAPGAPTAWAAAFEATRQRLPQPGGYAVSEVRSPASDPSPAAALEMGTDSSGAQESVPFILGLALLGGLILNLMPCVFPVLSIKAASIMEARGAEHRHQRGHALAYTAGVVGSTLAAGASLLMLRAMGESLGWGFQLQSPVFVAVIAYLLFALGLSMSGVVQFGTSIMGVGQSLTVRDGYAGSFFTGVLAVVVASPCTAPFMGTALGFALTQPAAIALAVFATLGLGLALPFLLIGFVPPLARLLPRPGAWMETFKQAMAFPLYLTVAWLVWVLARQTGVDAVPVVLSGLVMIAIASWLMHRHGLVSRGLRYAALVVAVGLLFVPSLDAPQAQAKAQAQAYSDARLAELRAQGRPVFVNLTADWCLTCKFNERAAIGTDAVREAMARRGVVSLVGDWTRSDPALTAVLARFNRAGVPLYLLYAPTGEPEILPQVLTPDGMIEAIERTS